MENHPIPQDVTGFKFKLIGSVTVKQFLYLLGFGILTTVAFVLEINLFVKIPLMLFFALIGVGLAFVPIEGRPMDIMLANFARTIPSENRYIFRKRGANLANYELFKIIVKPPHPSFEPTKLEKSPQDEKRAILLSRLRNSSFRPDEEELAFFKNIKSFFEEGAPITLEGVRVIEIETPKQPPIPRFSSDEESTQVTPATPPPPKTNIVKLQKELEEARQMQEKRIGDQEDLATKIKELERQLQATLAEKDVLAKKIVEYEVSQGRQQEKIFKPSKVKEERQETQSVRYVGPSSTLKAGFPTLPDVPNIVMGIIRDPRGKTLPNILVEVVDKNSIPVRAFKTNTLGQFASATPLPNGKYKVYFDDPAKQHEFEIIEIELSGDIFNPLEITSVDMREKLRRELFGSTSIAT